ncbi:four helix bundle protein [Pseudobythopirellula maris]|uniref:four helix bundle protein n=1 Tax=Pseudobythopirellula maris TaxID=2527991 RepID=UPI0011B83930|nr:four helix bundle protein [Pseudobythopirellula maris]
MADVESYRDLKVWKLGFRISLSVYDLTAEYPKTEQFGLTSQMRRCAVSLPSNIAEGHARESTRDFLRHLSIASGSLAELETQLLISRELRYVSADQLAEIMEQCEKESRMLGGLRRSLQKRL